MKRFILAFIAFILIFLSACVADVDSLYPDTSVSEAGTESVFSEAESANESLDASSETEESRAPYLDITLDLLPLLCNSSDPDEQDKVNDFLNFVLEYYSYNSEPLSDIYRHILENGYSDDIWMQYTGNSYYNDYIHFSGLGAQRLLESMVSGEYDVTEENLVEILRSIRTFQQEYDYDALLAKRNAGENSAPAADDGGEESADTQDVLEAEDAGDEE
ncbi:MAG: hypothetical protein J6R45_03425 [Clostridia bacterium]|nr:hypothetical protein [Clostridia bacterium]